VGLQDRDYMRDRQKVVQFARKVNWRKRMLIAAAVIAVLSSAVLLIRDISNVADDFGPSSGSLIVNINTATRKELETVPNIGPARAAQIIAGRPYESVDGLVRITGIGEKTLEGIKPFVTTEGETRRRETKAR
jgi:radical SAM superfamily enzyme with C-terminal helix-hairpin-helix motif